MKRLKRLAIKPLEKVSLEQGTWGAWLILGGMACFIAGWICARIFAPVFVPWLS